MAIHSKSWVPAQMSRYTEEADHFFRRLARYSLFNHPDFQYPAIQTVFVWRVPED
jgi:hypothetical protein